MAGNFSHREYAVKETGCNWLVSSNIVGAPAVSVSLPRPEGLGLQFGHFGKAKAGEILKILAVLKFFAGVENAIRVVTAGNGAIIRPGP